MTITIFTLFVFLFSVIVHEVAHGVVALRLGDTTAKDLGRLTLNPIAHLEPFGSFILPILLYFATNGAMIFGWAKPVPYNPLRLKNPMRDAGLIAAAGPITNLGVAIIFGIMIRILAHSINPLRIETLFVLLHVIVSVNILLAIFNLVPIPPLDGSKVLFALLPKRYAQVQTILERYGLLFLLLFITIGFNLIKPIINTVYHLIVGA